jgi:hypothetical protein
MDDNQPSGGAWNITGVLYQILGTLKAVAYYTLYPTTTEPVLVAEPRGGDLHEIGVAERQVSQFKTITNDSTWSLAKIVDDVFPDLYLAVDEPPLSRRSRYLFVTNGRIGRWARALEFFRDLGQRTPTAGRELDDLDDVTPLKFAQEYEGTERALVVRVVERVRKHGSAPSEPYATTVTKVWDLLSHFEFHGEQSNDEADAHIERMLRSMGVAPADVRRTRAALIGFVVDLSTHGSARFKPYELLGVAGLTGVPLSRREANAATALRLFLDDVRRAGFAPASRIERSFEIDAYCRGICFSGVSGQGKSSAMTAAAEQIASEYDHLLVFVPAAGSADEDFRKASEKVSREVLQRAETSSLVSLAQDAGELLAANGRPWLTIVVDNVQSSEEAAGLLASARDRDRVRILFTAPVSVADGLRADSVQIIPVRDFTTPELREFLAQHDWDWSDIPLDLRRVIHRPLLARLFVSVAGDANWNGTTEYALYEAYWDRLRSGLQADYPMDRVVLQKLAFGVACDEIAYPWTASTLHDAGVTDDMRRRLERAGWFQREKEGGASIWHDRLLNWAVAEAVTAELRNGTSSVQQVAELVAEFVPKFGGTRFGYVPMDVLWILMGDPSVPTSDVLGVVRRLEQRTAFELSSLYEDLVPSLGDRATPVLLARAQEIGPEDYVKARLFAGSLWRATSGGLPRAAVDSLLSHPKVRVQDVGLRYLVRHPRPELLDTIWTLHVTRKELKGTDWLVAYRVGYAALAAAVSLRPEWLRSRILEADPAVEPVSDLAYLLAGLGNADGAQLWRELKPHLLENVSKPRSLARCIHAYKDADELDRLVAWLVESNDLTGAAAFAALVNLDADRALQELSQLDLLDLSSARFWWLPWLILADGARAGEVLCRRIADADIQGLRLFANLYSECTDLMDPPTVEAFLQTFVRLIPLEPKNSSGLTLLDSAVRMLADCASLAQLRIFENHRGDEVEQALTNLAYAWVGEDTVASARDLEALLTILQRIGGHGYIDVVRASLRQLRGDEFTSVIEIAEACVSEVAAELCGVFDRFIDTESMSAAHRLAFYALRLLASIGDRERVLSAAMKREHNVEIDIPSLLADHEAISDARFTALEERLIRATGEERERIAYALGFTSHPRAVDVLAHLGGTAADEALARTASFAMDALAENNVGADAEHILSKTDTHVRLRSLLRIGTKGARDAAELALLEVNEATRDLLDYAAALLDDTRGPRVGAWMWSQLQMKPAVAWRHAWWRALRYVPDAREFLIEHATGDLDEVRVDATSVLIEVHRAYGTAAAERAMRQQVPNHASLSMPLLLADASRAATFLCDHIVAEDDELCRMEIGRAFRKAPNAVLELLPTMFASTDADVRRAACEIAGWLDRNPHDGDLRRLTMNDSSSAVQQAAMDAIRRQASFTAAHELLGALASATGMQAFTYADAITEIADPFVIEADSDSLCVWPIIAKQPLLLRLHLEEKLDKRAKAVNERAMRKSKDRRE